MFKVYILPAKWEDVADVGYFFSGRIQNFCVTNPVYCKAAQVIAQVAPSIEIPVFSITNEPLR